VEKLKISRDDIHLIAENSKWTETGANKILNDYVYSSAASWQRFLKILFISLGGGFTVSGVIFFFAYNWEDLDKFAKMGIMQFLVAASAAVVLYPGISLPIRQIVLTGASLLVGALFAVFGQIYQTGADASDFFLNWTIFITVWVIVSQFPPLWLIFIVLINTTWLLYARQETGWPSVFVYAVLFLFDSGATVLFHWLSKRKKRISVPAWFLYAVTLAAVYFSTAGWIIGIWTGLEGDIIAFGILALSSVFLYLLGMGYGWKKKNIFYPAILSFSALLVLFSFCAETFISSVEGEVFLSLFVIVCITGMLFALIRLQKKWKNEKMKR